MRVTKMKRKISFSGLLYRILLTLCLTGLSADFSAASDFRHGDEDISVAREDTIKDDLYVFGNYSEVRGTIEGDLTGFCYDISSNGNILGNANLFAYSIDFIGKIDRSARLIGYKVRMNGPVMGNLVAVGNDVRLGAKSFIGRDLTYSANNIRIEGIITGNVSGKSAKTVISAAIDGDVKIETDQLIITSPTVIKGELNYISPNEAILDKDVKIEGKINWDDKSAIPGEDSDSSRIGSSIFKFVFFLMSLITGLVLILLFRNHLNESVLQFETNFWNSFAIGCISFLGLTFGAVIPAVLIIGIPIAFMMFCLGSILFYIGKIYVGIALTRYLYGLINHESRLPMGVELLIGLIVLTVLFEIPVLGWIIYVGTFLLGTGIAINGFRAQCKRQEMAAKAI